MLPASLTAAADLPRTVLNDLVARHTEPHRRYHDLEHLHELVAWFDALDWNAPRDVARAMLFHDAVYQPTAKDNEDRSAQLALAAGCSERVATWIRLTALHGQALEVERDAAWFLDADMAILAAEPERFDRYMDEVEAAFAPFVPAFLFRMGRRRFLKKLLDHPIFLSDRFRSRLEARARANIQRAL